MAECLAALNAWSRALRRDECGDWRIAGTSGHIYADGTGWRLYVATHSPRAWTAAKKRLGFCRVAQDGADEGVFHLTDAPTPEQAAAIRKTLGIRKRLEHSQQALERMRRTAFKPAGKEGFSGQDARDEAGPRILPRWRSRRISRPKRPVSVEFPMAWVSFLPSRCCGPRSRKSRRRSRKRALAATARAIRGPPRLGDGRWPA